VISFGKNKNTLFIHVTYEVMHGNLLVYVASLFLRFLFILRESGGLVRKKAVEAAAAAASVISLREILI
jgi:hypothetical protein